MHICVISPSYPTTKTIDFVFVDQLCRAFADRGEKVTIIAPQSLTKCLMRGVPIAKRHSFFSTIKGNNIELYRPYYISLGNHSFGGLLENSFNKAVWRSFKSMKSKPDVCYGHFWKSIASAYPVAKAYNIPLFGASGEENVGLYVHWTDNIKREMSPFLQGVISVSSKNQRECIDLGLVDENKSVVIPNAVDLTLFKQLDRGACRKALNINSDDFVVAFVGQFVPRKGVTRLSEALKRINFDRIKAIFVGTGIEDPDYEHIIYKGRLPHSELPKYLNAADVFVLPTDNEGCSNALIEAMACGLPVISTDAPFNYDILNKDNSIMIDSMDVDQIVKAIVRLRDDKGLRQNLSQGAIATASILSIDKRATRIIEFMKSKM